MIQEFLVSLRLLHDFQKVERVILVPGSERNENDVELTAPRKNAE